MKDLKFYTALLTLALSPLSVTAQNVSEDGSLTANIKRVAIEYMEHSVTNKNDQNYPDSYNSDEQSNIGGTFDANLTYELSNMVWVNGLFAEYAKSETTEDGITSENEDKDEILIYTDYTRKMWNLEQGVVGPFAYLGYETEFTTFDLNGKDYRTEILRAKLGVKIYESKYFKQLYIAGVEEIDMTYDDNNIKSGAEIGYEVNLPINPQTNFISSGYYRKFLSSSEKEPTDFEYKMAINNRIETKLTGDLYLAPFYNYELGQTRGAKSSRSQSTFGLSLTYNKSFDL